MKKVILCVVFICIFLGGCSKKSDVPSSQNEKTGVTEEIQTEIPSQNEKTEVTEEIQLEIPSEPEVILLFELTNPRTHGEDVVKLQKRLLSLKFSEVGEADGYYGPLTENAIKTIQYFSGYEPNGKVDSSLWDFIFDDSKKELLANINIVSKYNVDKMKKDTEPRMGHSTEGGDLERYFIGDELKRANLTFYGETGKVHNCFYYISPNRCFLVREYYRYGSPTYHLDTDEGESDAKTTIDYTTYLKYNDDVFQIIKGAFTNTEFNVNGLIEMIGE